MAWNPEPYRVTQGNNPLFVIPDCAPGGTYPRPATLGKPDLLTYVGAPWVVLLHGDANLNSITPVGLMRMLETLRTYPEPSGNANRS